MNKETEEMQADVRNALTYALMDEKLQYIPDFDKPITEYLQKQGYGKVEDHKKEIFALKTTLEDREHEVRELNKKVERLNEESTKFLYDAGYRKQIWHKVADRDLPSNTDDIVIVSRFGRTFCALYDNEVKRFFIHTCTMGYSVKDIIAWTEGYSLKDIIAWTELPKYEE